MEERLVVTVHAHADLTAAEREATDCLSGDEGVDPRFDGYEWAPAEWVVVARLDATIVSGLKLVVRDISVGGQPLRVGGIGDVATRADMRRRGFAAAVMERAGEYLRHEADVDFGLLFCHPRLLSYYGRFGWQRVDGPAMVAVPWGKTAFPDETMVLACRRQDWPGGPIDLNGLPW